jgi:hypothetical protein
VVVRRRRWEVDSERRRQWATMDNNLHSNLAEADKAGEANRTKQTQQSSCQRQMLSFSWVFSSFCCVFSCVFKRVQVIKPRWVSHGGTPIFSLDIDASGSKFATCGR